MFLTLGASLLGIWTATVGAATIVPVTATLVSSPVQVPAGKTVTLSASFSSLPRRTPIATSAFEVTHERPLHLVGVGQVNTIVYITNSPSQALLLLQDTTQHNTVLSSVAYLCYTLEREGIAPICTGDTSPAANICHCTAASLSHC